MRGPGDRGRLTLFVAVVLGAALPGVAHAELPGLVLDWTAPPECPVSSEVERRIAQLVDGRKPREPLRVRAVLAHDGATGMVHGEVTLGTAAGQEPPRQLQGDACSTVSEAVVLIAALAIDPEIAGPPAPPAPPSPASVIAPTSATEPEAPSARKDVPGARPSVFLGGAGRADVGSLPAPAFGGEASLGIKVRRVSAEVAGAMLAPVRTTLDAQPGQGADIRLTDLGARGCYALVEQPFAVGPCAGVHARWLSASGFGSATPKDATAVFGLLTLGASARAHLSSRVVLRLALDAALPLSRPSFIIDAGGLVHRTSPLALRCAIGAELAF